MTDEPKMEIVANKLNPLQVAYLKDKYEKEFNNPDTFKDVDEAAYITNGINADIDKGRYNENPPHEKSDFEKQVREFITREPVKAFKAFEEMSIDQLSMLSADTRTKLTEVFTQAKRDGKLKDAADKVNKAINKLADFNQKLVVLNEDMAKAIHKVVSNKLRLLSDDPKNKEETAMLKNLAIILNIQKSEIDKAGEDHKKLKQVISARLIEIETKPDQLGEDTKNYRKLVTTEKYHPNPGEFRYQVSELWKRMNKEDFKEHRETALAAIKKLDIEGLKNIKADELGAENFTARFIDGITNSQGFNSFEQFQSALNLDKSHPLKTFRSSAPLDNQYLLPMIKNHLMEALILDANRPHVDDDTVGPNQYTLAFQQDLDNAAEKFAQARAADEIKNPDAAAHKVKSKPVKGSNGANTTTTDGFKGPAQNFDGNPLGAEAWRFNINPLLKPGQANLGPELLPLPKLKGDAELKSQKAAPPEAKPAEVKPVIPAAKPMEIAPPMAEVVDAIRSALAFLADPKASKVSETKPLKLSGNASMPYIPQGSGYYSK